MRLTAGKHDFHFPRRPLIMGIVNINHDSFSGDGSLDSDECLNQAVRQVAAGADIIDVGGESARTNREAISEEEEIDRVAPFIQKFNQALAENRFSSVDDTQLFPPLLSINTWRPKVADALLQEGGDILNDMSALPGPENVEAAVRHQAALLIMHSVGQPKVAHRHVRYENILESLIEFFEEKMLYAEKLGLNRDQIILDPGIEFAKQQEDNLQIYQMLESLKRLNRPVLLPVSRKGMIGEVLNLPHPADRDAGTLACICRGLLGGASIFRVHHVPAAWAAVKLFHALQSSDASPTFLSST